MTKVGKLVDETMKEMEKRGFTVGETKAFTQVIEMKLKRNSEQIAHAKPFAIFRDED